MKLRFNILLAAVLVFGLSACQDLSVENPNNPDRTKALASPQDVEALVANGFNRFWQASQTYDSSMMYSTIADEMSSSWANWGMRDMSSEPRIAWNNDPAYSRAASVRTPWFSAYVCISDAVDGLGALEGNEALFASEGIDTNRLKAMAHFSMGACLGLLGMRYDKAFIVDETVDLEAVALGTVDLIAEEYSKVTEAAVRKLDDAIEVARNNSFTISADDDWIFGLTVTNTDLIKIANSLAARYLALNARSAAERADPTKTDWSEIISRVDAGITADFTPIGDDNGDIREWDPMKFYGQEHTTWARTDYRTVGPADESGGYVTWLATPVANRNTFAGYTSSDRRITGPDGPTDDGKYQKYVGIPGPWPSARGTYHYATHTHNRFVYYLNDNANGPMPFMVKAEMDMYKAEGLLRTGGSTATVASLIDNTRVTNGELPSAAGAPAGSSTDGHWSNTQIHLNGTLWGYLIHEWRMETQQTAGGIAWAYARGLGNLVQGTPVHMPIPGAELETLAQDNYTFGGVGGEGGAPKGSTLWEQAFAGRTGVRVK